MRILEPGVRKSPVTEKEYTADRDRIARARQIRDNRVPEDQLQQLRRVTKDFDIARGKLAQQQIFRQPPDSDNNADDRRQHDRRRRDLQRIDDRNAISPQERVFRAEGDRRLADIETSPLPQKLKPRGDTLFRERILRVRDQKRANADHGRDNDELIDPAAHRNIVPEPAERQRAPGPGISLPRHNVQLFGHYDLRDFIARGAALAMPNRLRASRHPDCDVQLNGGA